MTELMVALTPKRAVCIVQVSSWPAARRTSGPRGRGGPRPGEQAVPAAREYGSGSEQQAATPGRSTADNNT